METLKTLHKTESIVKVVLFSALAFGVYTNVKSTKNIKNLDPIDLGNVHDQFGNFDAVNVPNKPFVIAKMVKTLKPAIGLNQKHKLTMKIHEVLNKYDIPPQIVLSIIDAESSFNQNAVSSTGDLSLAQINVEIWNKEFLRMKKPLIDGERLKTDEKYALETMMKILIHLKNRYKKTDRRWYARYHSKNKKFKEIYLSKLQDRMKKLEVLALH